MGLKSVWYKLTSWSLWKLVQQIFCRFLISFLEDQKAGSYNNKSQHTHRNGLEPQITSHLSLGVLSVSLWCWFWPSPSCSGALYLLHHHRAARSMLITLVRVVWEFGVGLPGGQIPLICVSVRVSGGPRLLQPPCILLGILPVILFCFLHAVTSSSTLVHRHSPGHRCLLTFAPIGFL